jgi:hypothetical protein
MSCGGAFSAVMSIAGAGVLQNVGLAASSGLTTSITSFTGVPAVGQFTNVLSSASGQLSPSTLGQLSSLGSSVLPALTNAIPSDLTGSLSALAPNGVTASGLTGLISSTASGIMGSGDLSKFTQVLNSATAYATQATQAISSALNIKDIANTFNPLTGGMNTLVTGGFNQVSTDFGKFGADLANLGQLVNLNSLPTLGDPSALLQRLGSAAASELPSLNQALGAAGISSSSVNNLALGFNDISNTAQKNLYTAFTKVTGSDLAQVKSVLGVTTPGITNMAQLLDPKAILPNSYQSLVMPTSNGLESVYTAAGSINTNIANFLQDTRASAYTGDDPIIRARLGLPPLPETTTI